MTQGTRSARSHFGETEKMEAAKKLSGCGTAHWQSRRGEGIHGWWNDVLLEAGPSSLVKVRDAPAHRLTVKIPKNAKNRQKSRMCGQTIANQDVGPAELKDSTFATWESVEESARFAQ